MFSEKYRLEEHKAYDRSKRHLFENEFDQTTYLTGFMAWKINKVSAFQNNATENDAHANKNDILDKTSEIESPFRSIYTWPFEKAYSLDLYACSLDQAPETIECDRKYSPPAYDAEGSLLTQVQESRK